MGPQKCRVCDEAVSKYKCPSCLAPYCSLGCFKRHKAPVRESHLRVDTPGCVLQTAQLGSLASSSDIREAPNDKGLRELIKKIDSSADVEGELDKTNSTNLKGMTFAYSQGRFYLSSHKTKNLR